jgi:hypothetical protein
MRMEELTVCKNCEAKFDPTIQWVYGWEDRKSTADTFRASGKIPLGNCPACRRSPQENVNG